MIGTLGRLGRTGRSVRSETLGELAHRLPLRPFNMGQQSNYSTYQVMMLAGCLVPKNSDQAVKHVKKQLEFVEQVGFFKAQENCLYIVGSHEFSFNGRYDKTGRIKYDASNPIPHEYFKSAVAIAQDALRELPEGMVYFPGTAAVDTGERGANGETIFENIGYGITSGRNSQAFSFSKGSISQVDGWVNDSCVRTKPGYSIVEIVHESGDKKTVRIACTICLDYKNFCKSNIELPNPPNIFFAPSCGWPYHIPPYNSEVIVVDGNDAPNFMGDRLPSAIHFVEERPMPEGFNFGGGKNTFPILSRLNGERLGSRDIEALVTKERKIPTIHGRG